MHDSAIVKSLAEKIDEHRRTPNPHLELLVGSIVGIFLEELVREILGDDPELSGDYRLLSPEWPIPKSLREHLSARYDWLLLNRENQQLLFVELAADASAFDDGLVASSQRVLDNIRCFGAGALMKDLMRVAEANQYEGKGDELLERLILALDGAHLAGCRKAEFLFIAPGAVAEQLKEAGAAHAFAFGDLPESIEGERREAWSGLRKALVRLDE